jgi:hypothetical protein
MLLAYRRLTSFRAVQSNKYQVDLIPARFGFADRVHPTAAGKRRLDRKTHSPIEIVRRSFQNVPSGGDGRRSALGGVRRQFADDFVVFSGSGARKLADLESPAIGALHHIDTVGVEIEDRKPSRKRLGEGFAARSPHGIVELGATARFAPFRGGRPRSATQLFCAAKWSNPFSFTPFLGIFFHDSKALTPQPHPAPPSP